MDQLSPQLMHKLVFTILMHGLNDAQTQLAHKVLTDALSHANPQVRELAVVALADLPIGPAQRVPSLALALEDGNSRVRRRAARSLGDQGPASAPAVYALLEGLHDHDPSVRRDCAGALGRIGPAAAPATRALCTLLDDPEGRTRAVVGVALQRIGRPAMNALTWGVRSNSPELRGRCATLLAKIAPGDEAVELLLESALTDEDAEVRARADEALQAVRTPPPVAMPAGRMSSYAGAV